MLKKVYLFSIIIIIINMMVLPGFCQQTQLVDSLFNAAVEVYRTRGYDDALNQLRTLDLTFPHHARLTASQLMQGKALYHLDQYLEAQKVFQKIIDDYSRSAYIDDAHYELGTVYYQLHMYKESVIELLTTIDHSADKRLQAKSARLAGQIMDNRLEGRELRSIHNAVDGERARAAITLKLARFEMSNNRYQPAETILKEFEKDFPKSQFLPRIRDLLMQARQGKSISLFIGVILPLTGTLAEQGQGILAGIQYALDNYGTSGRPDIELIVRDSQSDIVKAIKHAQELSTNPNVMAIIGEVESHITSAIAGVASEHDVVLLAPTASAADMTTIGSTIFQLASDLRTRAEVLAEYAISGLGLRRFLTFYPADYYGKTMAEAFASAVAQKGGEVLYEQYFFGGTEDLRPQFTKMREAGLKQMMSDSLLFIIPKSMLGQIRRVPGAVYVTQKFSDLVDSTALSINAYDGIFFPVYSEDLKFIIPQFAQANIDVKVFGGVPWHNTEILEEQSNFIDQRYIDFVFLSDYYIDPSDYAYFQLRDAFRQATGRTPEKMEVYGYDTANYLLSAMGTGILNRLMLRDALSQMRSFQGIKGPITINDARVNTSIPLLQFRGGQILRIK